MRYSLILVYKEYDGFVDGVWIQDSNGSLEKAIEVARDTEKANSNRITVAVVESLNSCTPDYNIKTRLKRIDINFINSK